MRRDAEHAREQAQKMERAEPGHPSRLTEIDRLIGVRIQPKRRLNRTTPIAGAWSDIFSTSLQNEIDKPGNKQQSRLVKTNISFAVGCYLHKFTNDHQLGERRDAPRTPNAVFGAKARQCCRRELERQTFVAPQVMIVSAHVFVALATHEGRSSNKFEGFAADLIAKAAAADVSDGKAPVHLGERNVTRAATALVVGDRQQLGFGYGGRRHKIKI